MKSLDRCFIIEQIKQALWKEFIKDFKDHPNCTKFVAREYSKIMLKTLDELYESADKQSTST